MALLQLFKRSKQLCHNSLSRCTAFPSNQRLEAIAMLCSRRFVTLRNPLKESCLSCKKCREQFQHLLDQLSCSILIRWSAYLYFIHLVLPVSIATEYTGKDKPNVARLFRLPITTDCRILARGCHTRIISWRVGSGREIAACYDTLPWKIIEEWL